MIIKVFRTGRAGIDYLKSKEFCPTILGDHIQTQELIDASGFKTPSTSGVLSLAEYIEDDEKKREICDRFAREILCPGIDPSEVSICWIEHQEAAGEDDKGKPMVRTGLHFVMCNTHLPSGKRLQPYYDDVDREHLTNWQAIANRDYGLSDPHSPENRAMTSWRRTTPANVREAQSMINDYVAGRLGEGDVADYEGIKTILTEELGLEINREGYRKGKHGVSVRVDGLDKPVRLSGTIYEPEFKSSDWVSGGAGLTESRDFDAVERKLAKGIADRGAKNRSDIETYAANRAARVERFEAKRRKQLEGDAKRGYERHAAGDRSPANQTLAAARQDGADRDPPPISMQEIYLALGRADSHQRSPSDQLAMAPDAPEPKRARTTNPEPTRILENHGEDRNPDITRLRAIGERARRTAERVGRLASAIVAIGSRPFQRRRNLGGLSTAISRAGRLVGEFNAAAVLDFGLEIEREIFPHRRQIGADRGNPRLDESGPSMTM